MTIVSGLFGIYKDVFLLFMIVRFTRKANKGKVPDELLQKAVPIVVAI